MIPAGITDKVVEQLGALMEPGDIIINGGNSNYREDYDRAAGLAKQRIEYMDVGTSGGVWGLERGYCLMIGGTETAFAQLRAAVRLDRTGAGVRRAHPGPLRRPGPGGAGLSALWAARRGPLREDGAQRHRVRDHGRLR